jgi:predicted Rossmann fold nucleotide-binding protein DprA/Smf involved in DNA uptake
MTQEALSADTKVVLLLCGRFGGERQEPYAPLSPREYGELARWLNGRNLRPSDLMGPGAADQLSSAPEAKLERKRLEFLLGRGTAMALALERWSRGGLWVISRGDPAFPKRLKQRLKHSAPPLLYGAGDKALLEAGGLAIIGSRDASESALEFTRDVASRCAKVGMAVVSGGARGVDEAAMQGATETGGCCLGVLAADLLKTSVNRQNRIGIQEGRLLLVSPFYPEAGFNAGNAMGRNRYIYALADQALVIDSALRTGGTWEGAVENLQHGWVPMYVRSPGEGAGNAALIAQGGRPFTAEDAKRDSLADFFEMTAASAGVDAPTGQASLPLANEPVVDCTVSTDSVLPIEPGAAVLQEVPPLATQPAGPQSASPMDSTSARGHEVSLDMFADFALKLPSVFAHGPLTEEDLAAALHLEKGQAKVWLKRACETGVVERLQKPVRYTLGRQGTLCLLRMG